MITDIAIIGAKIKAARKERGIKMTEMGKLTGISQYTIYALERGTGCYPNLYTVVQICTALKITPNEFVCDENDAEQIAQENASLREANKKLGVSLAWALRDMEKLDACEICAYWDTSFCRCTAPKELKKGSACFCWRGKGGVREV